MEKEISSGTMLGIVLIALAAVIGLGFGVFSIAKSVANEGTVGVQDNLSTVSDSAFDDYNDKVVTGTMVKSAVQNFNGKSVAIFINTTAMDSAVMTYKEHFDIKYWELTATGKMAGNTRVGDNGAGECLGPKRDTNEHYYINYNAILAYNTTPFVFELKDGAWKTDLAFFIEEGTGKVVFDNSIGGFSRTGNCEYLSPSAKFSANLIKDASGQHIGIVFTQMAK